MTNWDSLLKTRAITLPTKVRLVKAMVFPVVMCGCESWTVKKAEHWRTDAFELWCWRRLLRVPWTERRSNKSILKKISPGCSLEGLMLKLKLQYFGHLMRRLTHWKRLWCCEGLGARGEGNNRGWDGWMAWVWVNSGNWWWTGRPGVLQFMGSQSRTWLSDWTELDKIVATLVESHMWHQCLCSVVSDFATSWTLAPEVPLSMGFSRQEYQIGLPFPSPVDLPDPGIELASPILQADSLPVSHMWPKRHKLYSPGSNVIPI